MSDSGDAVFWDVRYEQAITPWAAGDVQAALRTFAEELPGPPRALIPGCGSGHEAGFLLERGWDVLAIDFSSAAIAQARAVLGDRARVLQEADFFTFDDDGKPFDVVYERAFLCALPPRSWPAYATRAAQLVRPGGVLAGFFFLAETASGPPFGSSQGALDELLGDAFEQVADDQVSDSLPVFAGRERWQVWRRIDDDHVRPPHDARERPA